ncbi:MAG: NAD(P)/FAD-dependent oxidoreductase [Agathobacter sp.]|nr:NAD(P)/FAD-dependent oxidoreductase [Agathobacter sp.]
MRYDCIIIGSGPAGLSAAINLKTYQKNFLWFGNASLSEKVQKAEKVVNYPGMPEITGQELAEAFVEHKESQGLEILDKIVSSIYDMGGYYNVMAENQFYETDTIILAMGVVAANQYAGEAEFVGRGVSYCATCDGMLYKGKTIAVVATSERFEHEIEFLADLAEKVYLFPYYKDCRIERENVEFIKKPIKEVKGGFRAEQLVLGDGTELGVDGIFIMRNAIAPTTLLNKLEVVDGHIEVNRQMETNIKGVFAAGDCTGKPYQYAKAVGEGNVAAHSVIEYLGEK